MKKLVVVIIVLTLFSGCSWYVRYPSVGRSATSSNRPTNWRGERCEVMIDVDTGRKVYVCGPDRFRR